MGRDERLGVGSVAGGVLVAVALGAGLCALGGALAASSHGDPLASEPSLAGLWILGAAAVGAFAGGRTTAAMGRLLTRRDGVLAGLVTGSVLAVLGIAAGGWLATAWPPSRAADLLWGLTALVAIFLLAAILGGVRGARAEGNAIGLRAVRLSRRGTAVDSDYERDFFEGASLSGNPVGSTRGVS